MACRGSSRRWKPWSTFLRPAGVDHWNSELITKVEADA